MKIKHVLHSCDSPDCYVCQGGLASCTVCHGGEASLPTDCPGRPMTNEEQDLIIAGKLDFVRNRWWTPMHAGGVVEKAPTLVGAPQSESVAVAIFDPGMLEQRENSLVNYRIPGLINRAVMHRELDPNNVQRRVWEWMDKCMGPEVASNLEERQWRVAEECCELLAATGFSKENLFLIATSVYDDSMRKKSYVATELADLLFCMLAMANAYEIDLGHALDFIIDRNNKNMAAIREKHMKKKLRSAAVAQGSCQ